MEQLLDNFISNEDLDNLIKNTNCLELLKALLNLKNTRVLNKKCERIIFSDPQIYEQEYGDIDLQCEVVKAALLVLENDDEEILNIITYLNYQAKETPSLSTQTLMKIAMLLSEIMSFCDSHNKRKLFQQNIIPSYINKFFLHILLQDKHPLRVYIMSCGIQNYVGFLTDFNKVDFLDEIFSQCLVAKNLDVLCIVSNCIDLKVFLKAEKESLLYKETFWEFIELSVSSTDNNNLQKQAVFLFEKWVRDYYNNCTILQVNINFLEINNTYRLSVDECKKIWQNFFILLDSLKEIQTHLIWPSLKLLDSLKYLNPLWQKCIYKILLRNKQNAIVHFIVSHILQENLCFPDLYKYLLSAINKNDYLGHSTKMYPNLPSFCNNLEDFSYFLECILEITWTPTAMWCLFNNLFCSKLDKPIPYKFFEPFYKLVEMLPHIYIRNGCMNIFMTYFMNHYNWKYLGKYNFNDSCKVLFLVKKFDEILFRRVVLKHIDINFLNSIVSKIESVQIDYSFDLKTFQLYVQILSILEHQVGLEAVLKNTKNFNIELLSIVYADLFDYYNLIEMEKFVEDAIGKLNENNFEKFLDITCKLMTLDHSFNEKIYSQMIDILTEPNNHSRYLIYAAFFIIGKFFKPHSMIKNIVDEWKNKFFIAGKIDTDLSIYFIELYFLTNQKPDISLLEYIFSSQSDVVITKTMETFSISISHKTFPHESVSFLKIALNLLQSLTKSRYFKPVVFNYINCVFSLSLFKVLLELEMLDIIPTIMDSLLKLSVTFPIIGYYLAVKIKYFVSCSDYDNEYSGILVPVIVELLLQGIAVKKDERIEYMVCQEIYERIGNIEDNPNMKKTSTRMISLESMLKIVSVCSHIADNFAFCLMEKYKTYFNKRYFSDSQIHLQKLRIIQALLTIHPFIIKQRQPLIDLIMESFCVEIHQPCVKQLMQWLLFYMLKDDVDTSLSLIVAKIDNSTKTQPSTIVAFIVVLLHLTLSKSESFWHSTVEALLPWCMGAHFKLRVYSQAAIQKLFKEARQKSYLNFIEKYGFLEKSVQSVIEASGQAFYETLKSDKIFFEVFTPERDYSLQSIYIGIPKLNGVTRTEWENITYYQFTTCGVIEISNKDETFVNSVIDVNIEATSVEALFTNSTDSTYIVQRKITPWRVAMEEQEQDKQLGDFILIASLLDKATNLGGLSRTCEVFGVKQLILNDAKIVNDKEFKSLSMTSENWVDAVEVKSADLKSFILEIRKKGYCVIGAEQTSESICLNEYKFKKKTALLLGNEKEGIPADLIPILDACIEIPQFGMVRSLNVHVAGATFIWEYAKQHLV